MVYSALFVLIAGLFLNAYTQKLVDPIVDTGYARYLGNRTFPSSVAYLGIPYAEPPLGQRRFRAPLPLNTRRISQETGGSVVDATKYADFCIQGPIGAGDTGGAGSEDCLKVDIYTPSGAKKGSNLPVLVYIHGGGYVFGNPANWPFNHWIHQSPNVVIVSVYYRLDSFGFLTTPEFTDSSIGDFNAGFQDQTEALRWVKRNIASFGGNPNKVTINGESAGGSSVELHLVANGQEGLFSGAIAQSVYRTPMPTPQQQQPLFEFYAEQAGCGSGSTSAKVACLRSASVSALARAQETSSSSAFTGSLYKSFHPVLDGVIFTKFPTDSVTSGGFASVPLIVGATTNETLAGGSDVSVALTRYTPSITADDINKIQTEYTSADFSSDALRTQTLTGDVSVRCARTIMGSSFSAKVPTWTYRYNQRNPTQAGTGVAHAAENWMMFLGTNTGLNGTTTFTPMTPVENSFVEELIAYWLSFVRSGNPNAHKLARSPEWLPYSARRRSRIVLQQDPLNSTTASGSFIELETNPETSRCTVIGSQALDQEN